MSDVPGQATCPFVEMRDKVVPDLPDNSGKEHLSIVNCGHDFGGGRSTIEGQKEISQGMMEIDGETDPVCRCEAASEQHFGQ